MEDFIKEFTVSILKGQKVKFHSRVNAELVLKEVNRITHGRYYIEAHNKSLNPYYLIRKRA